MKTWYILYFYTFRYPLRVKCIIRLLLHLLYARARLNCLLLIKKKVNKNDVSISRAHHPIRIVNSESQNYAYNNNNKAHMLQFTCTMLLCITIRDNFSGQKDVCSDGCIVFIVEEPSNRNYSQCDIENSIGVRERIIIL